MSVIFNQIVMEHFDMNNVSNVTTLVTLDETEQSKVLESLTGKLYQSIVSKVDDIDFGNIPNTKGDFTKLENYEQLRECLDTIKNILITYKQKLTPILTIENAISNLISRTDKWERAFNMKLQFPVMIYNTIALSIVGAISLMIATSIEFIKDAGDIDFSIKLDKVACAKSKDYSLFKGLDSFNASCADGSMDKALDHVFDTYSSKLIGSGTTLTLVGILGVSVIILNIIPIIRELIFFFFHSKQSISDYYAIQADLLQINTEYLRNSDRNNFKGNKKDIINKQTKIVTSFRKIANFFAIDAKTAQKKATTEIEQNKKKYNVEDIVDTNSSTDSGSSIF